MPRVLAARASAAAWLPDEWVTTPAFAAASLSDSTALKAPRALNAPTFWRFSHLNQTLAPTMPSIRRLVSTGVRCTKGEMRALAAAMVSAGWDTRLVIGPVFCFISIGFDRE